MKDMDPPMCFMGPRPLSLNPVLFILFGLGYVLRTIPNVQVILESFLNLWGASSLPPKRRPAKSVNRILVLDSHGCLILAIGNERSHTHLFFHSMKIYKIRIEYEVKKTEGM